MYLCAPIVHVSFVFYYSSQICFNTFLCSLKYSELCDIHMSVCVCALFWMNSTDNGFSLAEILSLGWYASILIRIPTFLRRLLYAFQLSSSLTNTRWFSN